MILTFVILILSLSVLQENLHLCVDLDTKAFISQTYLYKNTLISQK
jgi:hypothetical protein